MSSKLAWITGARGFLGRNLARYLSGRGYQVLGIGHGGWTQTAARDHGLSYWLNGEVAGSNLRVLLGESALPPVIYHFAGGAAVGPSFKYPLEDFQRTVDTTARLLEWVRTESPSTKVIVASSAAVYGAGHVGRIPEDTPIQPFSPYGAHKALMEGLCRSYTANFGLKTSIIRFFSVYGEGLEKQLLWDLSAKMAESDGVIRLSGSGGELRDWIHISDAVRLLETVALGQPGAAEAINGGTGRGTPVRDIVELAAQGWKAEFEFVFDQQRRAGDPDKLVADTAALQRLGFSAVVPIEDGIPRTMSWYKSQLAR